jgi:hypothetical protein
VTIAFMIQNVTIALSVASVSIISRIQPAGDVIVVESAG